MDVGGEGNGESAGIRTLDLLIKSQLLYRLSYALTHSFAVRLALPFESARNIFTSLRAVNPKNSKIVQFNRFSIVTRKGDWQTPFMIAS